MNSGRVELGAEASEGVPSVAYRSAGVAYCAACGCCDCPVVSAQSYWRACPATYTAKRGAMMSDQKASEGMSTAPGADEPVTPCRCARCGGRLGLQNPGEFCGFCKFIREVR